jgi:hypothetical protein
LRAGQNTIFVLFPRKGVFDSQTASAIKS